MKTRHPSIRFLTRFFDELLLNSGQYALFYIIMNFSRSGFGYFGNFGHTLLLAILIIQTSVLVAFGRRPLLRFLFSLIAPAIYTAIEFSTEGISFVLNMGHMFFWIFSAATGGVQAVALAVQRQRLRRILEFVVTTLNVTVFMVVYFYFDTKLQLESLLADGSIDEAEFLARLEIGRFAASFGSFIRDPAHVYLIVAGIILAASLGLGRVRVLELKEKIADLFGLYIDKRFRDRIIESGESLSSEQRPVTILFSDIRGFTTIAEDAQPDALTGMLNRYFSRWNEIVKRNHGSIDKYIGDAVMVVFGLERPEQSANDAVRCALQMLESFPALQEELDAQGFPVIRGFGVGINYGTVVLGDIGSDERRNFTVIGDAVNIASRLEAQSKTAGTPVVISGSAYEMLSDEARGYFRHLGRVAVRGRSDEIDIYGMKPGPARKGSLFAE